MGEHEQRDEPEAEVEETIRDLDVPEDQAGDVAGGRAPVKWDELDKKSK